MRRDNCKERLRAEISEFSALVENELEKPLQHNLFFVSLHHQISLINSASIQKSGKANVEVELALGNDGPILILKQVI